MHQNAWYDAPNNLDISPLTSLLQKLDADWAQDKNDTVDFGDLPDPVTSPKSMHSSIQTHRNPALNDLFSAPLRDPTYGLPLPTIKETNDHIKFLQPTFRSHTTYVSHPTGNQADNINIGDPTRGFYIPTPNDDPITMAARQAAALNLSTRRVTPYTDKSPH